MLQQLGRLVYDVEVKEVGEGKLVLNNRMAWSISKTESVFMDIVAWDQNAKFISEHFQKGYEILVVGRLINNQKKIKGTDHKYECHAIQVDRIIPTYGNPKAFGLEDVPDFLKSK